MKTELGIVIGLLLFILAPGISPSIAGKQPGPVAQSLDSLIRWVNENSLKVEPDIIFHYSRLALDKARLSGDPEKTGDAHSSLAKLHRSFFSYDSVLYHAKKALSFYVVAGNRLKMADCYLDLGYSFGNKLSFLTAEENIMEAIKIYEELQTPSQLSEAYGLLSYMFYLGGAYEDAIKYGEQSLAVARSVQDTTNIIEALTYITPVYVAVGRSSLGLTKANECLQWITAFDSHTPTQVMDAYYYRGDALVALNRLDEAWEDYMRAWEIAKAKWKLSESDASIFYTDGIAYIQQLKGDYERAIETNKNLITYLYNSGEFENLIETHHRLAQCYENLGNYQDALTHNRLAWQLEDSIKTLRSKALASELQIRYETAKREETIRTQKIQIDRQQLIQYLSLGVAILSLLLLSGLFYNYRHNKRRNQELQSLNNSLSEKNSLLDDRNAQNEILLKEIHHRVKNNLEIVSSLLELQSAQLNDLEQQRALLSSQARIQSMGIIHQKLYCEKNLSTIEINDYFKNLSEHILDSYAMHDRVIIDCRMKPIELDLDTAVPIGLIVNELLTNALKYAFPGGRTGRIEVSMWEIDNSLLKLVVADNGIGKFTTTSPDNSGFGSKLILLLTKQLGGTFHEEIANGTRVTLELRRANSEV